MVSSRPTIKLGSDGMHVVTVQECLGVQPVDGDFGQITDEAVRRYQRREKLEIDGVVGPATWAELEEDYSLPPYPEPMLSPLDEATIAAISDAALYSAISSYSWDDRGVAPAGYTIGMAHAFATALRKYRIGDSAAIEMGRAASGDADVDALSWYAQEFATLGMSNGKDGIDTLRHLFVMLMGLGMRESSGRHCEGRDMSADNVSSDTAEAGLFQMSWNASNSSDEMQGLMDSYLPAVDAQQCAIQHFSQGVNCSTSDWECYGSGAGYQYQVLAKNCPQFAVETAAIGLRNLRQHWGPINRREVELRREADHMFREVQRIILNRDAVA